MTADIIQQAFDGQPVRIVVDEQGEPWFVLADLCAVLGIANVGNVLARVEDDEKGSIRLTDGTPGNPNRATVNEPGMYSVILRSDSPAAVPFRRWVTHDVLPQIRRTGSYGTVPELTGPELLARAVIEAQRVIDEQAQALAVAAPKADAFDAFLATTGDYSVRDAAHVLSRHHDILTGEKRLRGWMLTAGWLYRDPTGAPRAYQRRIDQGVLAERVQWHYHPETGEKVADSPQVRVTARGIDALARALTKTTDQGELDIDDRCALEVS